MAYRKRFVSYARRSFRGYRRVRRTKKYGTFGLQINSGFIAGLAASFLPVSLPPVANVALTGLAVAPVKLGKFNIIKNGAQGFVAGKLLQQFIGNPLSGMLGGANDNNGGGY